MNHRHALLFTAALMSGRPLVARAASAAVVTPNEARGIARDAVIYGFPLVDNYRIQYSYFVDRSSAEFKAPWNTLFNNARVYTPAVLSLAGLQAAAQLVA